MKTKQGIFLFENDLLKQIKNQSLLTVGGGKTFDFQLSFKMNDEKDKIGCLAIILFQGEASVIDHQIVFPQRSDSTRNVLEEHNR